MDPTSIGLTVALISIIVWPTVLTLVGWVGGWRRLAQRYPAGEVQQGRTYRFQTIRLGGANYGNCVKIVTSAQGLYLSLPWIFRFGHPSMLIPWSELNPLPPPTGWIKRLGMRGVIGLEAGNPPMIKLYLLRRIFEDLQQDHDGTAQVLIEPAPQRAEI
jgi:hypothetical protein